MGLLGDAIHNLSDLSSSAVVFLGFRLSRRPASERYPYGMERAEDLEGIVGTVSPRTRFEWTLCRSRSPGRYRDPARRGIQGGADADRVSARGGSVSRNSCSYQSAISYYAAVGAITTLPRLSWPPGQPRYLALGPGDVADSAAATTIIFRQ